MPRRREAQLSLIPGDPPPPRPAFRSPALLGALDAFAEGYLLIDSALVILWANRAAGSGLGLDGAALVGLPMERAFPGFRGSVFEARYREAFSSGHPVLFESSPAEGGGVNWYEVAAAPCDDALLVRFRMTTRDRATAERLREQTEQLDAYFENALDLLCIADTDGRFVRLNRRWEETLGYRREELVGRPFMDFVHPDDIAATTAALVGLAAQRPITGFVNRYRAATGEWRWIEWNSVSAGRVIYAAARDISAHVATEAALSKSVADRELLLRELNHRVKNSLALIAGLVSLEAGRLTDEAARDALEDLRNRIAATGLLYEKLTALGGYATVDAASYLRDLAGLLASNLAPADGGLRLELELESIELDAKRAVALALVANEVLTNAYKHGFPGGRRGRILVSLALVGGRVLFRAADDGVGLPPGFDAEKDGNFGFDLMRLEAAELGGSFRASGPPGAAVELDFPLDPPAG